MDRKKRRVTYVAGSNSTLRGYGIRENTKKKKKKGLTARIKQVITGVAIAAMLFIVLAYALSGSGRVSVGSVTRIAASLSQNVIPFGDHVIFYDGTTLHCLAANGNNEWSYQIGASANYDATQDRIVAWSGNDLYIFNGKGRLIYNNKMSDTIQFASAGQEFVAVFVGDADNGVVSVINAAGQTVDNITVENQTLLDIGFFNAVTSSSAQETELMWMLGLDTTGSVISTELQTFQPGKLSTGKSALGEHIAYMIYDTNGMLNVVDTREISHYNYRVLEEQASTLIYGYTMADVKENGNVSYQLLVPAQDQSEGNGIRYVRLMAGNVDRVINLPTTCIDATLGTHSVYAFAGNTLYTCKFGETTFVAHAMPIHVTAVMGMLTDNRALVASGSEIYVVELPQ